MLALLLFTSSCLASGQDRSILVVGDSLSAGFGIPVEKGWVALLQERLEKEGYGYRVINASISGDTTSGGLRRLPRALSKHQPDIVVIELGGNDGLRGTPVSVTHKNLEEMIVLGQAQGAKIILAGMLMPPNYGAKYTQEFADIYPQLATKYELPLIEFFMADVALNPALMQADGIHPNVDGQPILLGTVWPILEPTLRIAETTSQN